MQFYLNGALYTQDQLASGVVQTQTKFEQSTVDFCHAWISGEKVFELQTSGSTGAPKKIRVRREQMVTSAKKTREALRLNAGMNALVCLDTQYIAGQMMLVRCFETGMNPWIVEPTANPLMGLPKDLKIHFGAFVPYQLQTMLSESKHLLDKMDCAIIGGASIEKSLKEKLANVKGQLVATYGMTETLSHIALQKLNQGPQDWFQSLPGVTLRVDERGCLVIETDYLDDEVITNDLVRILGEGRFQWLGRIDNVINSGGVKIIPEKVEQEIEVIAQELNLNNRFLVYGFPDNKLGEKVCLIMEGVEHPEAFMRRFKDALNSRLDKYAVPKEIYFVEKFVETNTGKVNRKKTADLVPV